MVSTVEKINNLNISYDMQNDAAQILYDELSKGIQSMKRGELFTIEEAWEEIDKIQ